MPQGKYGENRFTTKQEVIQAGMDYLLQMGADRICQVCIPNGGSCCLGCRHLKNGVGCQLRNTSCTAWLCGFQKLIFYEAGLIREWESFWDQVPGQDFRGDFTPPYFTVHRWLESPDIRFLSEAFAEDLNELIPQHYSLWIIELKDMLDRYVNKLLDYSDPEITRKIEKEMKYALKSFQRFQEAKSKLAASRRIRPENLG
ncbi:hypothetical protein [Paenibacillus koleovorans]|uniref:hypothetical protein n=1 Tax=Paenibacillus koleovorans TaxID=121608 RepID=UPI000FDADD9F|nr:hypothetical protein [Paenibacillus koleovorans]